MSFSAKWVWYYGSGFLKFMREWSRFQPRGRQCRAAMGLWVDFIGVAARLPGSNGLQCGPWMVSVVCSGCEVGSNAAVRAQVAFSGL